MPCQVGQLTVAMEDYNICKTKCEYKQTSKQETQLCSWGDGEGSLGWWPGSRLTSPVAPGSELSSGSWFILIEAL